MEARHLKLLLDFIYYGEVTLEQEELEEFIKTGEELKIKGLNQEESKQWGDPGTESNYDFKSIKITPTIPISSPSKIKSCPEMFCDPGEDSLFETILSNQTVLAEKIPL